MKTTQTRSAIALTPDQQALITPDLMNYATAQAMKYRHCCEGALQPCDLQQEALYGLCFATAIYDASAGATLKTFATYYIRKHVLLAVRDCGSAMAKARLCSEDRQMLRIISLDAPAEGTDADEPLSASLCIPDEDDTFADGLTLDEAMTRLEERLPLLTRKERSMVSLVHGLDGEPMTIRQAADVLGVSCERANQLYNKAIAKLQLSAEEK